MDLLSLPRVGEYRVILADPPWQFENWSEAGDEKNAAAHYDCMSLDELKALRIGSGLDFVCAPDCAMLMWATFPLLPEALELLDDWGFAYKSGGAWGKLTKHGKVAFGSGYLYRSAAELWLLGTRGSPAVRSHSVRNLILEKRREHSRKPDRMYDDVEALFDGPYLELFARARRPGWDSAGREVGKFDQKKAA